MADAPALPASLSIPAILERFANGEPLAPLAAELGVHPSTLYRYLLRASGPDQYYELKVAAHQVRIWEADQRLEEATDTLAYNKAHARAKLLRLDYERTCPKEYGPKQEVQVDHAVTITVNRGPVILPVVSEPTIISVNSEVIDKTKDGENK